MQIHGHDIGVCSWSLQPKSITELIAGVQSLGLSHIQLAVGSLLTLDAAHLRNELELLRLSRLHLTSTMLSFPGEDYTTITTIHQTGGYLPDDAWPLRKQLTVAASKLTADLGVKLIGTHIGFVPAKGSARYAVMLQRIGEITTALAKDDVTLLLETGQEEAAALVEFLDDLEAPNIGVNFDPANMILYGAGDPIEAIGVLAKFIQHVHVKDAIASSKPTESWGDEVPFGTGQVGPVRFLAALHDAGYHGPLVIEREAGENRAGDVKTAIDALR